MNPFVKGRSASEFGSFLPRGFRRSVLRAAAVGLGLFAARSPAGAQTWTQPSSGTTGTWSTSLWNPAVPVSGTTTALTFDTFGNSSAFTFTNGTAGFNLNSMTLNAWSTSTLTIPGGGTLTFGGTSPGIIENGPGSVSLSGTVVTSGGLTISGGGNGNLTIVNALSGTGGITVNETGLGIVTLTGTNTFTGAVNLTGGTVSFSKAASFGSATNVVTFGGGSVIFTGVITLATPITDTAGLNVVGASATTTLSGIISGAGGLNIQAYNTTSGPTLTGANTFTGATSIVSYIPASSAITSGPTLTLSGANGVIASTNNSSITIGRGATLQLTNASSTTINANRVPDGAPISVLNGIIGFSTSAAAQTETLGAITATGTMGLNATPTGVSTLTIGSLTRNDNAGLILGTSSIGTINSTTTALNVIVTTGGVSTIAAGTGTGTQTAVVPFAASGSFTQPTGFVTYTAAGGIQAVPNTNTTYVTAATNSATLLAAANQNVSLAAATYALGTTGVTVNALSFTASAAVTVTGTGGTLTVGSGAVIGGGATTWSTGAILAFGAHTGYIESAYEQTFTGTSAITGTAGLVIYGQGGSSATATTTFQNTGVNSFTGGLWVNGSTVLGFNRDNQLGATGGAITLGGGSLSYDAAASLTESRSIAIDAANGGITFNLVAGNATAGTATAATVLTLSGTISGAGAFIKEGVGTVNLTGTNTYSGGNLITAGTLEFTTDGNLGASGTSIFLNGGTLQNLAAVSTARPVQINASSTITPNFPLTLSGNIQTIGQLYGTANPTLTVNGTSTLSITGNDTKLSGILAIASGGVTVGGAAGNLGQISNVTVASGATLTFDNTAAYNGSRISGAAALTLSGGLLSYLSGGTPNAIAQQFGPLTNSAGNSVVSVAAGAATATTSVHFNSLTISAGSLTFRGDNLGVATGAGATEIFIDSFTTAQPILPNVYYAGTSGTGVGTIQTGYSTTLGIIPFTSTASSGTLIDNVNSPNTPLNAAYTTAGNTIANTGAAIYSLTIAGGNTLTLNNVNAASAANNNTAIGTLSIYGGILTSQGGATSIISGPQSAQTIAFGSLNAVVTTTTDLSIDPFIGLTGTGGLTKAGAGNLTVNGAYGITGSTVINAGTLTLPNATTFAGPLTVNAAGTFSAPLVTSITGGLIYGGGTFTAPALTSIAGGLTVNAGTFAVPSNVTVSGNTTVNGGTLDVSSQAAFTATNLSGTGGNLIAGAATLTLNNTAASTYAGNITGSTGLTMTGAGTLILSSPTTLSLGTAPTITINGSGTAGTLQLGASNVFPATSTLVVGNTLGSSGTVFAMNGFSQTFANVILTAPTAATTMLTIGAGTLTLTGPTSSISLVNTTGTAVTAGYQYEAVVTGSATGSINLSGGICTVNVAGQGNGTSPGDLSINAVIANGGLIVNANPSTFSSTSYTALTLGGPAVNTYTLGTVINIGTVNVAATSSLGTGFVTINQSGSVPSGIVTSGALTIGTLSTGSISSASLTTITLGGKLTVNQTANATFGGIISGAYALAVTGNSTLTLSAANTWSGATTIAGGSGLTFTGAGTALSAGALTVGSGTTSAGSLTFDNFTSGNPSTTAPHNRYTATAAVTLNNGAITVLGDPSNGSIVTMGALTITAGSTLNTITTTTNTQPVTLTFASLTSIASGASLTFAGTNLGAATLSGDASRILFTTAPTLVAGVIPNAFYSSGGNTGSASYDPTLGVILFVAGNAVSGTFIDNINNVGPGSITPTSAAFTTTGNTTANLGATINSLVLNGGSGASTLTLAPNVYGAQSGNNNTDPATLLITGVSGLTSQNVAQTITSANPATLAFSATANITATTNLTIASNVTLLAAGLAKTGAGELNIQGPLNLNNGTITLSAGILDIPTTGTSISGLTTTAGTTLNLNGPLTLAAGATTLSANLTGSGTLNATMTGAFGISGTNTAYTGNFILNAGTATVAAASSLGSGTVTLNTTGSVASTLTFAGANSIGTLSTGSLGTAAATVNIAASTTLTVNQATSATFAGILAGGNLAVNPTGTLTLAAANTYTGTTTINAGAGSLTFTGAGTALAAGALTVGNGGTSTGNLIFDNYTSGNPSTTSPNNRYKATSAVALNNGTLTVLGDPSNGSTVTMGALTVTAGTLNTITLTPNGLPVTLTFASLATIPSGASLTFAGTGLGAATLSGSTSRILFTTAPSLVNFSIPNATFSSGGTTTLATYDPTRGIISYVPGTATSGTFIDNINNVGPGSVTPTNADFTTTGNATANLGATVNSLVLSGGSTLTLVPNVNPSQAGNNNADPATLVVVGVPGISSQTVAQTITSATAATLSFPNIANITATTDLIIGSNVTVSAAGLSKTGAGNLNFQGPVNLNGGGITLSAGTITVPTSGITASTLVTTAGTTLALNGPLTYSGTGSLTVASNLTGTTGSFVYSGTGTVILSGTNTAFAGNVVMNSGTLTVSSGTNLGSAGVTLNGASLTYTGATGTAPNPLTLLNGGTNNLTVASGVTLTLTGALTGTGGLTLPGAGTVVAASTTPASFAGPVVVSGSVLKLGANNALPNVAYTIGNITIEDTASQLNLNGFNMTVSSLTIPARGNSSTTPYGIAVTGTGTLTVNGPISYVDNTSAPGNAFEGSISGITALNLGGAVQNLTVAGQNNVGSNDFTINAPITNGGLNISANPSSTVLDATAIAFSGANTYSLGTTLNAGTLNVAATSSLGTGSVTLNSGTAATAIVFAGASSIGSLSTGTVGSGAISITIVTSMTVNQTTDGTYAGTLSGGTLIKTGSAALTLSAPTTIPLTVNAGSLILSNTSSGAATVTGGSFQVTGTQSGAVTVSGTGVLQGTGTVSALATINSGGLVQGGSTATPASALFLSAGLTVASGGGFGVLISSATNMASDNTVTITGGVVTINSGAGASINGTGATFTPNQAYTYLIATGAGNQSTLSATTQSSFSTVGFGAYNFSLTGDSAGDIYVNFTPIPEPASLLLIGGAALFGVRRIRRRI